MRDPRTKPDRTYTLAMPLRDGEQVCALISASYFKSSIPASEVAARVVEPLRETVARIEHALDYMRGGAAPEDHAGELDLGF